MAYVKEFHTTGVSWNPKGVATGQYDATGAGCAAPAFSASIAASSSPAAASSVVAAAPPKADLFAALNKGGEITSGLKTVTKDMQTWRAEYKGGDAPAPAPKSSAVPKPAASSAVGPKGTPKFEFQPAGSKWVVENQGAGMHKVEIKGIKETVYIYGCVGATIEVVGKCKSIVIDGCKKTNVYFDNVMASCEVVNCQRMHVECREKCSAVAVDKTDGIVIKLSKESMDTEVVCSKSSEMNIQWLDDAGELIERPIPEQYVHRIKNGAITANVSDLYGH
jgi:adenylyl cyclase-associated protein